MSEDRKAPSRDVSTPRWRSLPARPRPEDLQAEHRDPAVPGSILAAPDAQQEFLIRHAN
ncbi:hypothetical protein AB0L00_36740 [Actinoallomurus sp. NPDC052308]|uniref:hypothetical protein n=1 Tax=Actinoallomurus sp. NPDC052308 TaxID=3155530 RepID=UPI0034467E62